MYYAGRSAGLVVAALPVSGPVNLGWPKTAMNATHGDQSPIDDAMIGADYGVHHLIQALHYDESRIAVPWYKRPLVCPVSKMRIQKYQSCIGEVVDPVTHA